MGFRRLRGRLDALQSDAHGTMAFAREVLDDFRDGFYVELEIAGRKLPVRVRVIADEEAANLDGGDVKNLDVVLSKLFELIGK